MKTKKINSISGFPFSINIPSRKQFWEGRRMHEDTQDEW